MMTDNKDFRKINTGKEGEKIATEYLKKNGYRIIENNYRCPIGEIDIVAREKNDLVFVEVKARKSLSLGYPEQAVGLQKQKKMSKLALWYLQENKLQNTNARFDVVAVLLLPSGHDVKLIRHAFELAAY